MRLIFICQVVDENDPNLASLVRWLREFANNPAVRKMDVLALRSGQFNLPANVTVTTFKKSNKLFTVLAFYQEVFKRLNNSDLFFVHMGGIYPILLLPFRMALGKPIYQWKTRTQIELLMHFCARFCDTKIFTASSTSFPLRFTNKVKVVGHGIDIDQFCPTSVSKETDLIFTGRVAPVKQIEKIIKIAAKCDKTLNIYGPILDADIDYKKKLDSLIKELNADDKVFFKGALNYNELPPIINKHRIMVSFNKGGLDKSVLEAMACGLPIITQNPCVAEILPPDLKDKLIVSNDNLDEACQKIGLLLSMNNEEFNKISRRLRLIVKMDHNIKNLFNRIVKEIVIS